MELSAQCTHNWRRYSLDVGFVRAFRSVRYWPYFRIRFFECKNLHVHVVSEYTIIPLLEFNKVPHRRATFSGNFSADTLFGGLCQRNRQVFGIVHTRKRLRGPTLTCWHTKNIQPPPQIICLAWCRPIRHVGGKVSRVFTACELPHFAKKLILRYFSYSHYHVHVDRPQCTIVAVQQCTTLHQGVVKLIQLPALHYRGAELGSYKIGGFTTKKFATRSTVMYWAQVR